MIAEIALAVALQVGDHNAHPRNPTPAYVREYVAKRATRSGLGARYCVELARRESRFRVDARNPESSARGVFQLLKLPDAAPLSEQFDRFERYIRHRYGGSCAAALRHHDRRGWY